MESRFLEEKNNQRDSAVRLLEKVQHEEANTELYEYRFANGLVVRCKSEERLNEYKKHLRKHIITF